MRDEIGYRDDPRVGTRHCLDLWRALRDAPGGVQPAIYVAEANTHRLDVEGLHYAHRWLLAWLKRPITPTEGTAKT